ncbi:hypothetical protein [Actinophytocola sp.]|uniref:hypothetical protein n=1 Tax=Actinophytocola sp. TaxID=1872138 RepID=UPI002D80F7FF|nr:hypothetical protein [Actinophytocola sp.]HET9141723.1 hypothetical protein [Actinophytocola sp.]
MATLELINLHCHRQQDVVGYDEARLTANGVARTYVIDKGGDKSLRGWNVEFTGSTTVVLDEMNGNNNTRLGSAPIHETGNPKTVDFKTTGAWYTLTFKVT